MGVGVGVTSINYNIYTHHDSKTRGELMLCLRYFYLYKDFHTVINISSSFLLTASGITNGFNVICGFTWKRCTLIAHTHTYIPCSAAISLLYVQFLVYNVLACMFYSTIKALHWTTFLGGRAVVVRQW